MSTGRNSAREPRFGRFARLLSWSGRIGARRLGGNFGVAPPDTQPAPVRGRLPLGDVRLAYLRWPAQGPALVLLHGLDATPLMWTRAASLLARRGGQRWDIVALALRGHGDSDVPERGYALEQTTADVLAALDALDLRTPVVLAGHSWGGKIAQHLSATHPERVRALLLADPVSPRGLSWLPRNVPAVADAALAPERQTYPDDETFYRAMRHMLYLCVGDELDRKVWEDMFRRRPDGSWAPLLPTGAFREILHGPIAADIRELVTSIRCPARLLRPSLSLNPLPSDLRALRLIPGLDERRIAGDHSFTHSNAIDTAAVIDEFLRELETHPDGDGRRAAGSRTHPSHR